MMKKISNNWLPGIIIALYAITPIASWAQNGKSIKPIADKSICDKTFVQGLPYCIYGAILGTPPGKAHVKDKIKVRLHVVRGLADAPNAAMELKVSRANTIIGSFAYPEFPTTLGEKEIEFELPWNDSWGTTGKVQGSLTVITNPQDQMTELRIPKIGGEDVVKIPVSGGPLNKKPLSNTLMVSFQIVP